MIIAPKCENFTITHYNLNYYLMWEAQNVDFIPSPTCEPVS